MIFSPCRGKTANERIGETMAKKAAEKETSFKLANPGISWNWLISLLIAALAPVIKIMSEGLRDQLVDFLRTMYKTAQESANPWDDYLFAFFLRVLGENPGEE